MEIGSFGNVVFSTNDERVLTFSNFQRDLSTEYAEHRNIGRKPTSEYIAPNLDTITFNMTLDESFGVKPREAAELMITLCRNGEARPLIIGTWALGTDMWVITHLGNGLPVILNNGRILKATLEVTLKEYVNEYD